ncbi:16S rRNA (guanine(966)-N(2))-methyltransferase RsmD [Clostridium sp. Cult3]|nr:16S rRNA (guanine(966)-N(2))-methyltransferase RsmD [Clostridium sp. Cult3]
MRVISGSKKGYRLKAPKGKDTRPTEDRIKESLFNILRQIDEESIVLDLYAGSGSIGIEFLSRGAKKAYFVDKSYSSIKAIRENLSHTDLMGKAEIIKKDALKAIEQISSQKVQFDYIFIDPPYGQNLIIKTLQKILREDILKEKGIIIVEHEKELTLEDRIFEFSKSDCRNYGSKLLTFYIINC